MTCTRYGTGVVAGCLTLLLLGCGGDASEGPTAPDGISDRKAPITPTVTVDLGPPNSGAGCSFEGPHFSSAFDVNSDRTVVGVTDCIASETLTFRWTEAAGMEFLANFPGGYGILGGSINERGNIAALFSTDNLFLDFRPIIWTPDNTRIDLVDVVACDPATSCGIGEPTTDINDRDDVVGIHEGAGFLWTRTTGLDRLPELGTLTPIAINQRGDIAATDFSNSVILLKHGSVTPIAGLGATDMNDKRAVVGATGSFPATEAALWTKSEGIQGLGTLGGDFSFANGINNRGEVVGASTNSAGEMRAFYWTAARGMVDLGPGIANAISDGGNIVGLSRVGFFGEFEVWHATLWRGTGGVSAAITARAARAPSPRTSACYTSETAWRSKHEMFRCLVGRE